MTSQLKTSLKKKIIKIKKIKIKTSLSDHPLGTISNPIPQKSAAFSKIKCVREDVRNIGLNERKRKKTYKQKNDATSSQKISSHCRRQMTGNSEFLLETKVHRNKVAFLISAFKFYNIFQGYQNNISILSKSWKIEKRKIRFLTNV